MSRRSSKEAIQLPAIVTEMKGSIKRNPMLTPEQFKNLRAGFLSGYRGIRTLEVDTGRLRARLDSAEHFLAPHRLLHHARIVPNAGESCRLKNQLQAGMIQGPVQGPFTAISITDTTKR